MNYKDLLAEFKQIKQELDIVKQELDCVKKENVFLKERLAIYKNHKNSRNSFIPPTQDPNRPKSNQSLRKTSGKTRWAKRQKR